MRRFAFALLAGAALTVVATAPAMARSPFDGPYVGAFAGYSDGDVETTVGAIADDVGVDGFTFGGYAGYGKTFDRFYVGGEGEVAYSDLDGDRTVGGLATSFETDWTYGLSARAGYLVTPTVLAYGRVGYQWTEFEGTAAAGTTAVSFDRTFDGWRFGGGVEVAITDNLLSRVEYTYTDYDEYDVTVGTSVGGLEPNAHTVNVGLAYRF
ncbi:outer membrane protein [Indioceanicola profundi]|uniref:outer membrane protein n=1 Tax=Indioceanicola profundi TaxID=2220096 RepID=UPI0013C45387|nr:outer membrane beta-barrel protein [Indioceanicola profundi]